MKKIYITSLHMMHGGVEMAITLLANALDKRGYEVEILCTYNLGQPVYRLNDNVKISYLTDVHPNREELKEAVRQKNPLRLAKEAFYAMRVLRLKKTSMREQFRKIEDGVIISTRNEHSVLLSRYGRADVKKIAQLHHDHKFDKKLMRDFSKAYANIDYFVLLTELLREEVQEMMQGNTYTKCVVIPNFLEEFEKPEQGRRQRQVITVGRLHTVKGFDRLIRLWTKMQFAEPTILKIVGDGEEREHLQALIRENQLEEQIVLAGAMEHEQVMEEMSKSLFYVMTSYSEAFPFVLIEAMAEGLPVLAFDVRVGPRAIVEDAKSGFLVSEQETEQFVEKAKLLADDAGERERMSQEALARAGLFMEKQVMQKWMDILEA